MKLSTTFLTLKIQELLIYRRGNESVLISISDAGTSEGPSPCKQAQGVVYSIPFVECSNVYIGQTGRSLKQRVSEHHRALKNGDIQAFALAEHVFKTGHAVYVSQSEVLDHHQHTTTRCMLESWYIQHNQAVLNRERRILLEVYTTLLD